MPQPFRQDDPSVPVRFNRFALQERPEHLRQIGLVTAAWADLEHALVEALSWSMGTKMGQGIHRGPATNVAAAALQSLDSLHARLGVVQAAVEARFGSELRTALIELTDGLRRTAKRRNRIVHGRWAITDAYPADILLVRGEQYERYTLTDFADVIRSIDDQDRAIRDFLSRLVRSMPDEGAAQPGKS